MPDTPEAAHKRHWRLNLRILLVLLVVWFLASFGLGIFGVEALNKIQMGGFPLGFWFAQQGSIYIFVVLILIYAIVMGRIDREAQAAEDSQS